MVKVNLFLTQGQNIVEIGQIIDLMEKVNLFGQTEIDIMVIGKMEKNMDMEYFIILMEIYMMENGIMIRKKEKEN